MKIKKLMKDFLKFPIPSKEFPLRILQEILLTFKIVFQLNYTELYLKSLTFLYKSLTIKVMTPASKSKKMSGLFNCSSSNCNVSAR